VVRGRKKKVNDYFGPEEEQAVADFLNQGIMIQDVTDPRMEKHPERVNMIWSGTTDHAFQRELIYNRKLREPLNKMVEYIIKRYKLYREGISFDELHMDALNNLILKAHKFDADRNKKAYSYYGTIIKRYLIAKLIEDDKSLKKYEDFDNVSTDLESLDEYQYEMEDDSFDTDKLITSVVKAIKKELSDAKDGLTQPMTKNEKILGTTLVDVLENKDSVTPVLGGGNKHDKLAILEVISTHSGLNNKEIRSAIRRYKILYNIVKNIEIEND
jgi:iron-sulfur cluster repair protein YtfE (RIC family)